MRAGFTLVEVLVSLAITAMLVVIAYQLVHILTRSEQSIDRESQLAITESTMMQQLLMDVRSALSVEPDGADAYRIKRLTLPPAGGPLAEQLVTWHADPKAQKVTRTAEREGTREYAFSGLIDPLTPALKLRIQKVNDATFKP